MTCSPSEKGTRVVPEDQLNKLFAQNAHDILRHIVDGDTPAARGHRQHRHEPAVSRHVVSIEMDAEEGSPLLEALLRPGHDSSAATIDTTAAATVEMMSKAAVATAVAVAAPAAAMEAEAPSAIASSRAICIPVPLRNRAPMHVTSPYDLLRPAYVAGSVTPREVEPERRDTPEYGYDGKAEPRSAVLWKMWHHSEAYGMMPLPLDLSGRPTMSGVVVARRKAGGFMSRAGGRDAGAVEDEAVEAFQACTFILTSPSGGQSGLPQEPEGGDLAAASLSAQNEGGPAGKRLDALLYVIPSSRTNLCRSCVSGRATAAVSPAGVYSGGGSWAAELRSQESSACCPDPLEVTEQAKKLVEGKLRLALSQPRREMVWSLFKNTVANVLKQSVADVPRTPRIPVDPRTCRRVTGRSPRAPSPAFAHATTVEDPSGVRRIGKCTRSHGLGLGEGMPGVRRADLWRLVEVSMVTPLSVADPQLSNILDPKHGVNWGAWFQHLAADSLSMFIAMLVVEEDGDVQGTSGPASAFGNFATAKTAERSEDPRKLRDRGVAVDARSTLRTLVMIPKNLLEPERAGVFPTDIRSRGGGEGSLGSTTPETNLAASEGEGPWARPYAGWHPPLSIGGTPCHSPLDTFSLFLCVTLDEVGLPTGRNFLCYWYTRVWSPQERN